MFERFHLDDVREYRLLKLGKVRIGWYKNFTETLMVWRIR